MLEHLFYQQCKWETITYLNIESVQSSNYGQPDQWFEYLTKKAQSGCFPALQEVKFSMRENLSFAGIGTPCWQNLHTMEIDSLHQPKCDVLASIAEGIEHGIFPSLKVVQLCNWAENWPADKLTLRSKGLLVHFVSRDKRQYFY